jgi:alpha-galactosidase/6-phospho-beta-glucosidase family protein
MENNPKWGAGEIGVSQDWVSTMSRYYLNGKVKLNVMPVPLMKDATMSGIVVRPSQLLVINKKSANSKEAVKFVNWFFNDSEAILALKSERGIPPTKTGLKILERNKLLDSNIVKGLNMAVKNAGIPENALSNNKEFAPNAWVINYTNPMTLSVRILYEVFPEIKAFGCCHEVFGTQKLLAAMLVDQQVATAVRREEIQTNVLGINHFTWINQAYYRGIDLFPLYRRFAEQYYATGFQIPGESDWQSSPFGFAHRVKFDLFLRYGLIAAAGDRHLVEFLPPWYLKDPETVADWKFHLTPVAHRVARFETWSEQRRRVIAGTEEFQLKSSGEEGVKQIKALVGLGDLVTNINLPNYGQIEGLPRGAVVETQRLSDQ